MLYMSIRTLKSRATLCLPIYEIQFVTQHFFKCSSHFVGELSVTQGRCIVQEGNDVFEVCVLINYGIHQVL